MPFVGYMDDGKGGLRVLKNHPCGSTLSRPLWLPKAAWVLR